MCLENVLRHALSALARPGRPWARSLPPAIATVRQLLHALLYLLSLTAMDGGNAKGLQEQSSPCSRAEVG